MKIAVFALVALGISGLVAAASPDFSMAEHLLPAPSALSPEVQQYVKVPAGKVALVHVRVIDGTGSPALEDQTVLLDGSRITAVQHASINVPMGYTIIDASGLSVFPGIVGMHDHQFRTISPNMTATGSDRPRLSQEMIFSTPRLSLAAGVTTLRTTGSLEPNTDLNMKKAIDQGIYPGPHMDVTAAYLQGEAVPILTMHHLNGPEDARKLVDYWSDMGATSFKAHVAVGFSELKAAADAAHSRGRKIAGHVCAVTYPEAVAAGIDSIEHGFWYNTQFEPGKAPGQCLFEGGDKTLLAMAPGSDSARALIKLLIDNDVALTSTLAMLELAYSPNYRPRTEQQLAVMNPLMRHNYELALAERSAMTAEERAHNVAMWRRELALEKAFFDAGGLLMAGPDPTGWGDVIPGFGDQRSIEILVDGGFTPVQAIRVGTLNGAIYLGVADRIGSIAAGKNADLVLVRGDPSTNIEDIENVVTVFKDGVGYDPQKLLASVKGDYGQY